MIPPSADNRARSGPAFEKATKYCEQTLFKSYCASFAEQKSPFAVFINSISSQQQHSDLAKKWSTVLGIPKMATLAATLIVATESDETKWDALATGFIPLLKYYLFEAASDDISVGVFWREPTAETLARVEFYSRFCAFALDELRENEPAPDDLRGFLDTQHASIVAQSDSPHSRSRIIQEYCATAKVTADAVIASGTPATLGENLTSLGELATVASPTQDITRRGLISRYEAAGALITTSLADRSARSCLRTGGESGLVVPSIMFMIGTACNVGSLPGRTVANALATRTSDLERATVAAGQLIRIYNDLGTQLSFDAQQRTDFFSALRNAVDDRGRPGTELYSVLQELPLPKDRRLAKDIRQGENNIVLESLHWSTTSQITIGESLDFLEDRIEALAALHTQNMKVLDESCHVLEQEYAEVGKWMCRLIRSWAQFNAKIYSQPADTFWGDYLASDGH